MKRETLKRSRNKSDQLRSSLLSHLFANHGSRTNHRRMHIYRRLPHGSRTFVVAPMRCGGSRISHMRQATDLSARGQAKPRQRNPMPAGTAQLMCTSTHPRRSHGASAHAQPAPGSAPKLPTATLAPLKGIHCKAPAAQPCYQHTRQPVIPPQRPPPPPTLTRGTQATDPQLQEHLSGSNMWPTPCLTSCAVRGNPHLPPHPGKLLRSVPWEAARGNR